MMPNTPRAFVGSVVFFLDGPVDGQVGESARSEIARIPGIRSCDLDAAGMLVVTAWCPVDRADVVEVLDRLGCRLRT